MAFSRNITIGVAVLIAIVLIAGAYLLSGRHFSGPSFVNAESSQELLQAYAAKDSDGDGLPDWEEALYGTDPNNAHSVRADITDGQAVAQGLLTPKYAATSTDATSTGDTDLADDIPGNAAAPDSITDQFARLFFTDYMNARGTTPLSASDMQTFVQNTVSALEATRNRPDAYTASNLKVSGTGSAALEAYAAAVNAAFQADMPKLSEDELTYFSDAVQKGDASAVQNISAISTGYLNLANALVGITAPTEMASAHLAVVNAMARLGDTIGDLAAVNDDPIRGMLGLGEYGQDATDFLNALRSMKAVFDAEHVAVPEDGASFFNVFSGFDASSTTP